MPRDELVSAGFGDQDLRLRWVGFDLLPQPVNMGLERVGRHPRIIAPDLMQQDLPSDHPLAGAIEKFEDVCLFLGQPDLAVVAADQHLRRRLEGVGPDLEHRVLALLVLAQLRPDAGEQHPEAERLGDIVVGAGIEAENGVGLGVLGGQHDDRPAIAALAHLLAGFPPVHVRQPHIEQNQVDHVRAQLLQPGRGRRRIGDLELVMQRELLFERLAQCIIIVDDENLSHGTHSKKLPGTDGQVPA